MELEDLEAIGIMNDKDRRMFLRHIRSLEWRPQKDRPTGRRGVIRSSGRSDSQSDTDGTLSEEEDDEDSHSGSEASSSEEEDSDTEFGKSNISISISQRNLQK